MNAQSMRAAGALLLLTLGACAGDADHPRPPPPAESELDRPAHAVRARAADDAVRASAAQWMRSPAALHEPRPAIGIVQPSGENYAALDAHGVRPAAEQPVSTFSIDVDTGSYANVRRWLGNGTLPPRDAVRVEELINYFDYGYAPPRSQDTPFAVHSEIAPTPWNPDTLLLRIGLQGFRPDAELRPANLVFLVDVSGSMHAPDKLALAQQSLRLLSTQLGAEDRISLVTYAGDSRVVLEPTPGDDKARILAAIDGLAAGGGTHGAAGIRSAYRLAREAFIADGVNRVILATDGDFNVGVTDFDQLLGLARDGRRSGIALTTLGFGQGNYNDHLMEQLADAGDGNHAYIDQLAEAQKVLVRQRSGTLQTIARDVKIQIEFNPAVVAEYRLIGYENRMLAREDFNNDAVDAGDIGAGHNVTALYEIALVGSAGTRIDPLRYGTATPRASAEAGELAFLRLRYKRPGDPHSRLIEQPLRTADIRHDAGSDAFRLAAAVAAYGQLLRDSPYLDGFDFAAARRLAASARGDDPYGDEGELLKLVELAGSLRAMQAGSPAPAPAPEG